MPFESSKWIWADVDVTEDQYCEFKDTFSVFGNATVRISVDGDYTLYVNGKYVASGQYGDFEHYKIYDEINVKDYIDDGENDLKIIVHHPGKATSRYRPAKEGLLYEVISDEKILAYSSESTESRLAAGYASGRCVQITQQLGFGFAYDLRDEGGDYAKSVLTNKNCTLFPRPIRKSKILDPLIPKYVKRVDNGRYLIDLGREVVGLLTLDIVSDTEQKIKVAYGEHIADGQVRYRIGNRDFSMDFVTRVGRNQFTEYMLRIACRYLEIYAEDDIDINLISVLPQVYEVDSLGIRPKDELDARIYDICENTLRLCMMEHYVDCPWREQCLYAFDSRNQMLCGYYTFKDGNAEYARANLKLIGKDTRDGDLLSICYPAGGSLAIPSFSLYYFMSMKEYIDHTGDTTLAKELYEKLISVMEVFVKNADGGLAHRFAGDENWNFYDWSDFSDGRCGKAEPPIADCYINLLFVIALDSFEYICERAGLPFPYVGMADKMRALVNEHFYVGDGRYTVVEGAEQYHNLVNALAILSGAAKGEVAKLSAERITEGKLSDCSLSMKVLEYDALLSVDCDKYSDFVLDEIRVNYKKMLDCGSDTVWETIDGESAFYNAGSLCHGWSSIPIYIYHKLGLC